MSIIIRVFDDCKYRQYQRGCPISSNFDFPAGSYGCYLPGDEPGYICGISGDYCDEDDKIDIELCKRIQKTELKCPICLNDCEEETLLYKDKIEKQYYCPECEEWIEEKDVKGEN